LCSGCAADRITHLYAEWDVSVSQCDEVSRERDEARDRVAHLDAEWDVLAGQLEAAESERDEARAEVERLRYWLGVIGDGVCDHPPRLWCSHCRARETLRSTGNPDPEPGE
jgi:hypothetical protein